MLRRYSHRHTSEAVGYEHRLLRRLAALGWPVAPPVEASDGRTASDLDGRRHALFPHLPGEIRAGLDPPDLWALGRTLAELHATCEPLLVELGPRPSFPPLADLATRPHAGLDDRIIVRRLRHDRALTGAILAERDAVFDELASLEPATLPRTLIHGDFHAGNLLFHQGWLTGLLDFDYARPDARVVDLAIATIYLNPADTDALVAGYAEAAELEDRELAGIAVLRRARRLEHVGVCLGLRNLDTAVLDEIRDTVATIARERQNRRVLSAAAGGRPGR